jgi:hypothetical protein
MNNGSIEYIGNCVNSSQLPAKESQRLASEPSFIHITIVLVDGYKPIPERTKHFKRYSTPILEGGFLLRFLT